MLLLIGFLFFILVYVGFIALMAGGSVSIMLLDLPAFSLLFVTLLFFLFVSKSGNIILKYIKSSFKKEYVYSILELESLSAAIKNVIKFIIATGILSFITFIIVALAFLGTPEALGPNLAMALISLTYAIAISFFVFFPVQAWAENKINVLKES